MIIDIQLLKSYFTTGSKPTQTEFYSFIDSMFVGITSVQDNLISSSQIDPQSTIVVTSSSSGEVNLTSNPQITDGENGQIIFLVGSSDTNFINIQNGNGLLLESTFSLKQGNIIQLLYNTSLSSWVEISRSVITHNYLNGLNDGDYKHLTATNFNSLTGAGDSTLHYHSSDRDRSNHTGSQLATTISDFGSAVVSSLPSQAGQTGNFLGTDGSDLSWQEVDALPDQSSHIGKFLITDGSDASWSIVDHNNLLNTHNLTTDIDHDSITNSHNLTNDIDHNTIFNNHNLTTDIDHGDISGLSDDDHPQYILVNGTRSFSAAVSGATPTQTTHLTTKGYVDGLVQGLDWQESVLDRDLTSPPGSPLTGDRYLVASGSTGDWSGQDGNITEWTGSAWSFTTRNDGMSVWVEDENVLLVYNGTNWVRFGSTLVHNNLSGLNDGDYKHVTSDINNALGGTSGTPSETNKFVTDDDSRMDDARTPISHDNTYHSVNFTPETRTLTAGTGLSGGGTLAANRTFNVDYGTTAGTACQGNDVRLSDDRDPNSHDNTRHSTNYAAETITLTAGTGLSGGGNLTANRSFSVDYGTTAGTACQGNDARLSDARTPVSHDNTYHSTNYTPESRTLTAGTGLSGGGTLAANRTFNVDYGTTAGTACQGNDARLSDSRPASDVYAWAKEANLLAADVPSLDASKITTGTLDLDRIPHGAIERLVVVADQTARFALSTSEVQNGDTVKQTDTGVMYFVVDDTKLNSEDGYSVYTAGAATSVPWTGVTDKPSTFTPSSHDNSAHSTNYTPDSRTLTAGTGLSGGGDLTANRTFNVDYGTTAGTACEGNDSRLSDARTPVSHDNTYHSTNYTPESRTLTAGTGLSGGGNLTTNRTFSVDYGTTAGTACEGNDNRLSNDRTPLSHGNEKHSTNYAAESITLTAGTGLSGGGNLTANRSFSVDYGTTAGTACQGNDARLSDARTPTSHAIAGSEHSASTLSQLNAKISDATLDDSSSARTPTSHDNTYHSTNFTPETRNLTAGNGLSGGGTLAADRTFTMGTPSTINSETTNSVTSTSHTHELGSTISTSSPSGGVDGDVWYVV